jgi:hypothetical protein
LIPFHPTIENLAATTFTTTVFNLLGHYCHGFPPVSHCLFMVFITCIPLTILIFPPQKNPLDSATDSISTSTKTVMWRPALKQPELAHTESKSGKFLFFLKLGRNFCKSVSPALCWDRKISRKSNKIFKVTCESFFCFGKKFREP